MEAIRGGNPYFYHGRNEVSDLPHYKEIGIAQPAATRIRERWFFGQLYDRLKTLRKKSPGALRTWILITNDRVMEGIATALASLPPDDVSKKQAFVQALKKENVFCGGRRLRVMTRILGVATLLVERPEIFGDSDNAERFERYPYLFFRNLNPPKAKRQLKADVYRELDAQLSESICELMRRKELDALRDIGLFIAPTTSRGRDGVEVRGEFRLALGLNMTFTFGWNDTARLEALREFCGRFKKPWVFERLHQTFEARRIIFANRGKATRGELTDVASTYRLTAIQFTVLRQLLDAHAVNQLFVPWSKSDDGFIPKPDFARRRGYRAAPLEGGLLEVSADWNQNGREFFKRTSIAKNTTATFPLALYFLWRFTNNALGVSDSSAAS